MKILIACEFSGIVRDAFIKKGHDAISCDLLPTELPGPHIQGDVLNILNDGWDMMIAHPPCTYLSSSGMHWTTRGLRHPKLTEDALSFIKSLLSAKIDKIALENPIGIISSRIRKPDQIIQPWQFGHDSSKSTCLWLKNLRKLEYTKIIPPKGWKLIKFAMDMFENEQEYEDLCGEAFCKECNMNFADCECFGPTQDGIEYKTIKGFLFGRKKRRTGKPVWGNQTPSGQNKLGPSDDRWAKRSITYQGIANAMADQWG